MFLRALDGLPRRVEDLHLAHSGLRLLDDISDDGSPHKHRSTFPVHIPLFEGDQLARSKSRPEGELNQVPKRPFRSVENKTHLFGRERVRLQGFKRKVLDPVHGVSIDDSIMEGVPQGSPQRHEDICG